MTNSRDCIVFDGELIPADKPVVPVVSRGLMYGDGIFETFRTYSGETFFLEEHLDRLHRGCEILGIPCDPRLRSKQLQSLVHDLLRERGLVDEDAIIRLQVWRDGQRGYQPAPNAQSHFSIVASVCPSKFSPLELVTVNRSRIPSQSLPSEVKLTNGINYILAVQEASEKGGDDALMETTNGWISETTIANIFWVRGNTFFTPDETCDLIPGITRSIVSRLIENDSNWELEQGKYGIDHLMNADAAFICNSVREILEVRQVNERRFDIKSDLLKELKARFQMFRDKNIKPLVPQ
jgi:branched-subunit amino acid aminotransferase/4-amino-4-deoxychorismate lyase